MIKILWLIHLMIQEVEDWQDGNIYDIFIEEINRVL